MSEPEQEDRVCLHCHVAFRQHGPVSRSFLGFVHLECPDCSQSMTYPLTNGYRIFYWCFVLLVLAACIALFSFGGNPALPGILWFAAVVALFSDASKKAEVRRAWQEHNRMGQPSSVKPTTARAPLTPAERDPIRWYHVVFAIMLPYVAAPWGIVNLIRKRRRSGLFLLITPLIVFAVTIVICIIVELSQQ